MKDSQRTYQDLSAYELACIARCQSPLYLAQPDGSSRPVPYWSLQTARDHAIRMSGIGSDVREIWQLQEDGTYALLETHDRTNGGDAPTAWHYLVGPAIPAGWDPDEAGIAAMVADHAAGLHAQWTDGCDTCEYHAVRSPEPLEASPAGLSARDAHERGMMHRAMGTSPDDGDAGPADGPIVDRWHVVQQSAAGYSPGAILESFGTLPEARAGLQDAYRRNRPYGALQVDSDTVIQGMRTYRVMKASVARALNIGRANGAR